MNMKPHTPKTASPSVPGEPTGSVATSGPSVLQELPASRNGSAIPAAAGAVAVRSYDKGRFDEIDAEIIRESVVALANVEGPRLGDFVRFPDGDLHRIALNREKDTIQTARLDRGSYFMGLGGFMEFSGSLEFQLLDRARLELTDETLDGAVWTFHHGDVAPGGRVDGMAPFRVYAYNQGEK